MNNGLLAECIQLMVERIKSKYVHDIKQSFGTRFNLETFKNIDNIHVLNSYAKRFLNKLGQGSSRAAYLLSGRYVLKIAINKKGLAQNETEASVYTNPKTKEVVAKIHDYDHDYKWLISDVVNPIKSEEEFEQISGEPWQEFIDGVWDDDKPQTLLSIAARSTVKSNDLMFGDVDNVEHWGKTPDGRVVLLDYGFTGEVFDKYYSKSPVTFKTATSNAITANARDGTTKK